MGSVARLTRLPIRVHVVLCSYGKFSARSTCGKKSKKQNQNVEHKLFLLEIIIFLFYSTSPYDTLHYLRYYLLTPVAIHY